MAFDVSSEWITPELSLIGPIFVVVRFPSKDLTVFQKFLKRVRIWVTGLQLSSQRYADYHPFMCHPLLQTATLLLCKAILYGRIWGVGGQWNMNMTIFCCILIEMCTAMLLSLAD